MIPVTGSPNLPNRFVQVADRAVKRYATVDLDEYGFVDKVSKALCDNLAAMFESGRE